MLINLGYWLNGWLGLLQVLRGEVAEARVLALRQHLVVAGLPLLGARNREQLLHVVFRNHGRAHGLVELWGFGVVHSSCLNSFN